MSDVENGLSLLYVIHRHTKSLWAKTNDILSQPNTESNVIVRIIKTSEL